MAQWSISLDAWIVQDGNYPDFERGQQADFAVEFYFAEPPTVTDHQSPSIVHVEDTSYAVVGRVLATSEKAWVLDCGIGIYQELPVPAGVEVGRCVRGTASLGVDPFFYFERLHALPEMPPLVYTWRIDAIWRNAAPFVRSGSVLVRDPEQLGWIPLERTDAWHDDDGRASYRLDCVLLDSPPKRSSSTAT